MEKLIPAILEGEAKSVEITNKIAKSYQNCPYVAFMATVKNQVHIVYFLPEKQRWWVEYIEKKPQNTLGLEKVKLIFPQKLYFPKKMKMRLLKNKAELAPCNADCSKDPVYITGQCLGCPSTIYYKGK
jgi:hypothetical protein